MDGERRNWEKAERAFAWGKRKKTQVTVPSDMMACLVAGALIAIGPWSWRDGRSCPAPEPEPELALLGIAQCMHAARPLSSHSPSRRCNARVQPQHCPTRASIFLGSSVWMILYGVPLSTCLSSTCLSSIFPCLYPPLFSRYLVLFTVPTDDSHLLRNNTASPFKEFLAGIVA